jgi:hypothetical protein
MDPMRRLLLSLSAVSLLSWFTGCCSCCHYVAGKCDCVGPYGDCADQAWGHHDDYWNGPDNGVPVEAGQVTPVERPVQNQNAKEKEKGQPMEKNKGPQNQ